MSEFGIGHNVPDIARHDPAYQVKGMRLGHVLRTTYWCRDTLGYSPSILDKPTGTILMFRNPTDALLYQMMFPELTTAVRPSI